MVHRSKWKRFRPQRKGSLHDQTTFEVDSVYSRARMIIRDTLQGTRHHRRIHGQMKRISDAVKKLAEHNSPNPEYKLARLILQAPGAARAQMEMDRHKGGYANRQARLFELIDFNDTFDETVLAMPDDVLPDFTERLKNEMTIFCHDMHLPMLTDKQYEAIVHGLSREIALYRGARSLGYRVRMTSRLQDAMGVDMVITDPETKRSINIDCKTSSSYHFRLIDLQKEHRLNEGQRLRCELEGFCKVRNGHGRDAIETVLFRLATEDLGRIRDFDYIDLEPLGQQLRRAMDRHGSYIV